MKKRNNKKALAIAFMIVCLTSLFPLNSYSQEDSTWVVLDSVSVDSISIDSIYGEDDVPIFLNMDSESSARVDSLAQSRFHINIETGPKYALFDCRSDSVIADSMDVLTYSHSVVVADSSSYCYFYFEKGLMNGLIGLSMDGYNKVTISQYNPKYVASLDECTTIDSLLTKKCRELLLNGMKSIDGFYGQLAVVDVPTGQLKAWVALRQNDNKYEDDVLLKYRLAADHLLLPISVAYAMVNGNVSFEDSVDVGGGIYETSKGERILDHNWRAGGYGKMTYLQGLERKSNVAMYKAIEKVDSTLRWSNYDRIFEEASAMDMAAGVSSMYWYGDYILWPSLIGDSVTKEPNTDYSPKFQEYVRKIMTDVNKGDGIQAKVAPKNVSLAGLYGGTTNLETKQDGTVAQLAFGGCFPADNPRYAIGTFIDKSPKGIIIYPQLSVVVNGVIDWLNTNRINK